MFLNLLFLCYCTVIAMVKSRKTSLKSYCVSACETRADLIFQASRSAYL